MRPGLSVPVSDAVDADAAAGGLVDAADQVQQGRFAASAGPGNRQKLARGHAQAGMIQRRHVAVVQRETCG